MAKNSEDLIRELVAGGYLASPALIEAFRAIDRKDFVPNEYVTEAYGNYPLPIGFGQTISQPLTVAFMLELLSPQPGERILEIGAGSGWQTALLAQCVREKRGGEVSKAKSQKLGCVVAIERIPELKKMAEENVHTYNFIEEGVVRVILGDGSSPSTLLEAREGQKFDKIIAAASAQEIPEEWKKQLKVGGRIVAPVGQSIMVLDKITEDKFKTKEYPGFVFVPLVED